MIFFKCKKQPLFTKIMLLIKKIKFTTTLLIYSVLLGHLKNTIRCRSGFFLKMGVGFQPRAQRHPLGFSPKIQWSTGVGECLKTGLLAA
jgi:hypothetical protein